MNYFQYGRLLTAIEKRQITRLGSTQPKNIDIRLICATNADIHNMVTTGKFRQDLLYRINTIEIPIPPLRERGKDILLLAEFSCSDHIVDIGIGGTDQTDIDVFRLSRT